MTVTNLAISQQVNLAGILNTKLEKPILQSEMGLDSIASTPGMAVRYNEFSNKHNNDGSFKGIDQPDIKLTTSASATQNAIRWDEFSNKHNNDGSFKTGIIATADIAVGAITQPKMKIKSVVALGDVSATPTATQMIDSGIFTITPTVARTLTTDTAVNIVAGIPGYQVGTYFEFTIVNNAAFDVTLVAGAGVILVGKAVINNGSGTWLARIDSSTGVTIYRE